MENKFELVPDTLILDIDPIEVSSSEIIATKEDVAQKIEEPLQESIVELMEKGIKTLSSSANRKDIPIGYGHVILDYESLSQENKGVVKEQKYQVIEDFGLRKKIKVVEIRIPLDSSTTQKEFIRGCKEHTSFFKKQAANWIPTYSTSQIMEKYGYGLNEKEVFLTENPNGVDGYYFDQAEGVFYLGEWLYEIKKRNANF